MTRVRIVLAIVSAVFLSLTVCKKTPDETSLKVGATPVPHAEILSVVKPLLAAKHIRLEIVEFTDYVQPNEALASKDLDANFFQHVPYLSKFAADRKLAIKPLAAVHIEPMGIYGKRIKSLTQLPTGAKIAIPNDPTNGGRALALLAKAGLIELKPGAGINATTGDISANPRQARIIELEAAQLPRSLDDVAIAVINTNFALEAGLNPAKDALFIESGDSPYANVVAIRGGDEKRPAILALKKALTSPEVKKFILDKYKGAIVPAF